MHVLSRQHLKRLLKNPEQQVRIMLWASSLSMGVSFIFFRLEWLTLLSVVGWFYYVEHAKKLPPRQVFIDWYVATFIISTFAFSFLLQAATQNWNVSLHGWFAVAAQIISWGLVCSFCSLSGLLLAFWVLKVRQYRFALILFVLGIPVAELLRSYLFSVISYGAGATIAPHYNMGSFAVAASGTPLVYASRLCGFFGLSLLTAMACLGGYLFIRRRWFTGTLLLMPIVLCTFIGLHLPVSKLPEVLNVATVHLNETDDMATWMSFSSVPNNVDILVLPEYSGALDNPQFKLLAAKLTPDGVGITTKAVGRSPQATNKLTFFNNKGDIISAQDKTSLVPTGEYLPYSLVGSFYLIGQQKNITNFTYTQKLMPGTMQIKPIKTGKITIGALACSGVVSPNGYANLVNQGANILVNSASLSFLSADSRYHVFARNMARFQAVANRRPFLQASRSGQTYIIDAQGNFLKQSTGQNSQVPSILL